MLSVAPTSPLIAALLRHYDQLVEHVRRRSARWGGDGAVARDVVHDVCVQLIEAPPPLAVQTPLAFLRSVATRRAIDRHRGEAVRAAWTAGEEELLLQQAAAPDANDPARIAAGRQRIEQLGRAIEALPPRCRDVFVLHKIHQMPQAQVATHLGISLKTVEKHLRLGVAACLAALGAMSRSALSTPPPPAVPAQVELDELLLAERERLKQLFPLPAPRPPRARKTALAAGAASLGAALLALLLVLDPAWQREEHAAVTGERRELLLADGSKVSLDSGARVSVSRHLRSRQVQLLAGRARFEVMSSAWRGFTVDAGIARVRVLGTVFDVDRRADRVEVSVLRGRVAVCAEDRPDAPARLQAGQRLRVAPEPDGGMGLHALPGSGDDGHQAWTQGQLVFRATPLPEVLAELQRYRAAPIRLEAGAGLEQLRLSGVFDSARVDESLALLPRILPVTLRREEDGGITIRPR